MKRKVTYIIFAILAFAILYGVAKIGSFIQWLFGMLNL